MLAKASRNYSSIKEVALNCTNQFITTFLHECQVRTYEFAKYSSNCDMFQESSHYFTSNIEEKSWSKNKGSISHDFELWNQSTTDAHVTVGCLHYALSNVIVLQILDE